MLTTSSNNVNAKCVFNLSLFNVANIRLAAACAFSLPTTPPTNSGTRLASTNPASFLLLAFSGVVLKGGATSKTPPGHIKSMSKLMFFAMDSSER